MAAPKVQKLSAIMAALNPAYARSTKLLNAQIAAVPKQLSTQTAALNAAKTQGFTDINTNANSKGLAFSGIPTSEQATYLSTKYLPALADLRTAATNQKTTLQQALASLYQDQYKTALSSQEQQKAQLADWQKMIQQEQFQASQSALDRAASAAQAAAERQAENTDIQIVKNPKTKGWTVLENGKPSKNYDLASAAAATNKDLISLLINGSAKDRKAAQEYYKNLTHSKYTGKAATAYAQRQLLHDAPTAFYLGGTYGG